MYIEGSSRTWTVRTKDELSEAISSRDSRGGGVFWLASSGQQFPCMAIRSSGPAFDVHYFPLEGHPGYRYRSVPAEGTSSTVLFQYDGCDPYEGESVPREFTIPFDLALAIADHFMFSSSMYESTQWLEL